MKYDEAVLKEFCQTLDWGSYLIRHGGVNRFSSKEGFEFLQDEYFDMVQGRIDQVKEMLKEHENELIHFAIAKLYSLHNLEEERYRNMKQAETHARKSLEFRRDYQPAMSLLAEIRRWQEFLKEMDE